MPATPGLSRNVPRLLTSATQIRLVISCVDCRLLDDLVRFLDHDNLGNRYYHADIAGASIGLSSKPPGFHTYGNADRWPGTSASRSTSRSGSKCSTITWKLVLKLTRGDLTDIYIVEHADCSAYKAFLNVDYYKDPTARTRKEERKEHFNRCSYVGRGIALSWLAHAWRAKSARGSLRN